MYHSIYIAIVWPAIPFPALPFYMLNTAYKKGERGRVHDMYI